MQILENGTLETFVLTISLAEALNGQCLGRGRQFKKALWLVLLVSDCFWKEVTVLGLLLCFSMSYSKWSC